MNGTAKRDTVVGLFVAVGLLAIAYLSFSIGGINYRGPGGLTLTATFDEIGGLKARAPVLIAGVKVGQVTAIELDANFRARVLLDLDANLKLPVDSSAAIRTAGLLGDQNIHLAPGAETEFLTSGEEIAYTESAIVIESLVGKLIHNLGLGKKE